MINSIVLMLSGYKRSGKDSFYQTLTGKNNYRWKITKKFESLPDIHDISSPTLRRAFADIIKKELNINEDTKDMYDETIGMTPRDQCILYAREKKSNNQDYFCQRLLVDMLEDDKLYIITDFRYPNEYTFMKQRFKYVYTMRISRDGVPVPDLSIESEHQLDNFEFDYLVESSENSESSNRKM